MNDEDKRLKKTLNGFKALWEGITNTKVDDTIIKEILKNNKDKEKNNGIK